MSSVTGIDNNRINVRVGQSRRPFHLMTHNNGIYAHSRYGQQGITETFTLYNGAAAGCEVDNIGVQILRRHFKGSARTRTRFPEHVYYRFAVQQRQLLISAVYNILHLTGRAQNQFNIFLRYSL